MKYTVKTALLLMLVVPIIIALSTTYNENDSWGITKSIQQSNHL